jgi:TonB family protein
MHGFNILTEFNNIAKVQGKFLVREILAFVEQQKMFTVRVEVVEAWNVADSALTHAPGATLEADLKDLPGDAPGQLVKKQQPVYPILAMATRRQGTVVLDATIGIDGKVRDLNVIYDPTELFGAAALEAVSHWQYKPYLHNGEPVEVKTIINVFFRQNR